MLAVFDFRAPAALISVRPIYFCSSWPERQHRWASDDPWPPRVTFRRPLWSSAPCESHGVWPLWSPRAVWTYSSRADSLWSHIYDWAHIELDALYIRPVNIKNKIMKLVSFKHRFMDTYMYLLLTSYVHRHHLPYLCKTVRRRMTRNSRRCDSIISRHSHAVWPSTYATDCGYAAVYCICANSILDLS